MARRGSARAWPPPPPSWRPTARPASPTPGSTWLTTEGNPVHEFVSAATALCPPDLSVDVTIDDRTPPHRRVRRHPSRQPPGGLRRRGPDRHPVGARPVRRRLDHQRWLSAGPQPLPVGEGTGRGGAGGGGRRDHRDGGGVHRRRARGRRLRPDPRVGLEHRGVGAPVRRRPRSTGGSPRSSPGSWPGSTSGSTPTGCPTARSVRPGCARSTTWPRAWKKRWPPAPGTTAGLPGCACCPGDHSPWPHLPTTHRTDLRGCRGVAVWPTSRPCRCNVARIG